MRCVKFLPLGRRLQSDDEGCLARAHDSGHKQVRRARPYGRRLLQRLPDVRHDEPRKRWPRGDRGSRGGRLAPLREALRDNRALLAATCCGDEVINVLSARVDFKYSSDNLNIWGVAPRRRRCSTRSRRWRRRSATVAGPRSSTCSRRASARSRSSRARSPRASPTPRSICRCWRGPGWCARAATARGSIYRLASERVGELWAAVRDVAVRARGRGRRPRRRVPGRARRGRAADRRGARRAAGARRGRCCSTCARSPSIGPATSPARVSAPLDALAVARRRAAAAAGDRRLLPRPVLRLRRRRGAAAPRAGPEGAPAGRRLPRVAARRAAGRDGELTRRRDAASTVPERRELVRELPVRLHDARASSRSSTRTPTSSTTTSRPRPRSARRSSAVFETHVQADHVSGLPALVERTGATAYLPAGAGVEFEHVALADGDEVELGNTIVTRDRDAGPRARPSRLRGRRPPARHEEPWLVFSGDSLLIGDVGRPDLHVAGDAARAGAAAAREPAPAARAARPRRRSTRATTPARSAAAASLATRSPRSASSARTTRCSRSPTPDAFADALARGHAAAAG